MSYVCLAVSKNGAVVSGDSRITYYMPCPIRSLHHEFGRKVFRTRNQKIIWACTGILTWGFWHYPLIISLIMNREDLLLEERLFYVKKLMCRQTRPAFWMRIPLVRDIPFIKKLGFSKGFTFNLLYAQLPGEPVPAEKNKASEYPVSGAICFQNGHIFSSFRHYGPVVMENGANQRELSPLKDFIPSKDATIEELTEMVNRRVMESIQKDKDLKKKDRKYVATVGGRVKTKSLKIHSSKIR